MAAELSGSLETGFDDNDMKSLMHLLITSNFPWQLQRPP